MNKEIINELIEAGEGLLQAAGGYTVEELVSKDTTSVDAYYQGAFETLYRIASNNHLDIPSEMTKLYNFLISLEVVA